MIPADRQLRGQAEVLRKLAESLKDSDPARIRRLIEQALKRTERRIKCGLSWLK
jgi:hypothetical protein